MRAPRQASAVIKSALHIAGWKWQMDRRSTRLFPCEQALPRSAAACHSMPPWLPLARRRPFVVLCWHAGWAGLQRLGISGLGRRASLLRLWGGQAAQCGMLRLQAVHPRQQAANRRLGIVHPGAQRLVLRLELTILLRVVGNLVLLQARRVAGAAAEARREQVSRRQLVRGLLKTPVAPSCTQPQVVRPNSVQPLDKPTR